MNNELARMYRQIQETPAVTLALPESYGRGEISRLESGIFSFASWRMEFSRDTFVEGEVGGDLRLFFCLGEGAEWTFEGGRMELSHQEACFCLSGGRVERMCYQGNLPYSFFTVSISLQEFVSLAGRYFKDPQQVLCALPGRRFPITGEMQRAVHELGALEAIQSGFERMRLEARLLEVLSFCLQEALMEPVRAPRLHPSDLEAIKRVGGRIEEDPGSIPDLSALSHEYGMSVSKLTRRFREVYGTSLHAYVIEARLQKGARLLLQENASIGEVAAALGYIKPSQFSADFRRRFGVSPSEFRGGRS